LRKFASITIQLQAVTALMALALVAVFATSAERAHTRRAAAERIHAVVSVSRDLFMAMQAIRVERDTGSTGMETATAIDHETQREITALRVRSNTALDSALAKLKNMGIADSDPDLAKILAARTEFDHIRASAEAAMLLPKTQRPPAIGGLWIASASRSVDSIDALCARVSGEISQADPLITEMMKLKQLASVVRDAAGTDRLLIGAAIANGNGITSEQQQQFATLAGRMDAAWQLVAEDARWLDLPPRLKDRIAKAQKLYFQELRAKRKTLLDDVAAGRTAAITGIEWVNLSNSALEAIIDVANVAFDLSDLQGAKEAGAAARGLVGALALTLFFLAVGALAILFVIRRIAQPMATITTAMRAVADGDLEREAPFAERRDEFGELARTLAIFRDKGRESRRLAAELLQQERLSALGQLTATVAHELRNPLSAIRNTVYTFRELATSKGLSIDRPMERVERSITRCDRIIGDLLDFTRMRDLHPSAAVFDKWLDEVLNDQKLPEGVSLVRNLSAPGHALSFDGERMRQVVINLIDNAAQAMASADNRTAAGRIVVTTAARFNGFELTIADNGPGIAPENIAKVFDPLFSTKSFGTGLGLPMVKQVIEQHGGTVEIGSTPGKGTKVTIRLPHTAAATTEIAA
jgi:signal transduction histidine kinase